MQSVDPSNFFRTEADLALSASRKEKAERNKELGSPIDLPGKPLSIEIRGNDLWTAESGAAIRRTNLETGKTLQVYHGHKGPVTSIALLPSSPNFFSGSWDGTIKTWSSEPKALKASTSAHSDFVKCLKAIPSLGILVSGGSDKVIRFWDISNLDSPLVQIGTLSEHTRPVECLAFDPGSTTASSCTLFTADTMGVVKIWTLDVNITEGRCRPTLVNQFMDHRTGINDMWYGLGTLWTGSTDCTVIMRQYPTASNGANQFRAITLPHTVKSILPLSLTPLNEPLVVVGSADTIVSFDISSPEDPEQLRELDVHAHDVVGLGFWVKKVESKTGAVALEPWIISASLDGTVRRWPFKELITPAPAAPLPPKEKSNGKPSSGLTEEEERELNELLSSDEE
ncbi:WD40 repeat-like protein [Sistotremastrum niveocremeum HHB9708]|uniref:WD40 repeat-like protein n=2 Tax=Sistotremastraceae TaxID=3402574 RepID=A0A165AKU7_9AGAM|nr:WD40 repeat-like protein [Sistotremastrum niveocremeum HHB9708]KZT42008.1 WD40 repeat-like protein [Sistotremastrum suecicum HHB10207 ss-3]